MLHLHETKLRSAHPRDHLLQAGKPSLRVFTRDIGEYVHTQRAMARSSKPGCSLRSRKTEEPESTFVCAITNKTVFETAIQPEQTN